MERIQLFEKIRQFMISAFSASLAVSGKNSHMAKRRKFTNDEDQKLKDLVAQLGTKSWEKIARLMPERTARQCRDRYKNYLIDTLVSDPWTPEEDAVLIRMFHELGPKWVEIAKALNGRSGNNVKNRWHKHLAKYQALEASAPSPEPEVTVTAQETASNKDREEQKPGIYLCKASGLEDCDWSEIFAQIETDIAMNVYGMFSQDELS